MQQELEKILGANNINFEPDQLDPRLTDHRQCYRAQPVAIAEPTNTQDLSALLRFCYQHDICVVPQGGNTGYAGGATPQQDHRLKQILICLNKMNKILSIDSINYTITAQAGCLLEDVQSAARSVNRLFPLALGSQGSCQIGGNIATNAGGVSVLKYGNSRDLLLGIEAVLADGRIVNDLNALRKNNTGYNLAQLFAGSEGTLGIITKVVLKTFPLPIQHATLLLAFESLSQLLEFYQYARQQSADTLSSFEYISAHAMQLVSEGPLEVASILSTAVQHFALVEFSSPSEFLDLDTMVEKILQHGMSDNLITDGSLANSQAQRTAMWRLREAIPETERLLGGSIKHDISLPISALADFLNSINQKLTQVCPEYRLSVYGHIGDGNLHFNLLHPDNSQASAFKENHEQQLSETVYRLTDELGGSFSAEHGIGQSKLAQLTQYKDPTALQLMRNIKSAIDPKNLMNPGKLIDLTKSGKHTT